MKQKKNRKKQGITGTSVGLSHQRPFPKQRGLWLTAGLASVIVISLAGLILFGPTTRPNLDKVPVATPTFTRDVAPIVFEHCSSCHRPGQSAPFTLLSYKDVRKHAEEIIEVTQRRYMPPWPPELGCGDFAGSRRLSDTEIRLLWNWWNTGAPEGAVSDLPPQPRWAEGWQLGEPDLVVTMPEPYEVAAAGPDAYRNFVIPIPLTRARYIRAIEFRPGNWKAVHHAFIKFDATRETRRIDEAEAGPGFDGIHAPFSAQPPSGQFLSWQPGKVVTKGQDGLTWKLDPNTDLVLQTHLRPTGKKELLQSSVGFYFSEQPPTNTPIKIWLSTYDIDIPAGEHHHQVEQKYRLPTDVDVLAVLPHAHYLGKSIEAEAVFPNGSKTCLIRINEWDFNWQGDYQYAAPVFLPQGTEIRMKFTYDNSAANLRNPHHPPQRVRYGPQSTDEMAELWLQVLPRTPQGFQILQRDCENRLLEDTISYNLYLLRRDPRDVKAAVAVGRGMLLQGRLPEAFKQFQRAALLDPGKDEPYYYLGVVLRLQQKPDAAIAEFARALAINPRNAKTHGNLGTIFMEQGKLEQAETEFRSALQIDPADELSKANLDLIQGERRRRQRQP